MEVSDEVLHTAPSSRDERGSQSTDKPAALLRGSARGLEIVVEASAGLEAIVAAITARLSEAPTFFRGSDVRIRVEDGPLPTGSLARLEDLAGTYELRIVEIGAAKPEKRAAKGTEDAVPLPTTNLAAGSAPTEPRARARSATDQFENAPTTESAAYRNEFDDVPTVLVPPPPNAQALATALALAPAFGSASLEAAFTSARHGISWVSPPGTEPVQPSLPLAEMPVAKPLETPIETGSAAEAPPAADQLELALRALAKAEVIEELEPDIEIEPETRIVIGPVRSGVILDHRGHLIVFGDVNPGAEVRAAGNIVVLGRLRGLAHAGIGADAGFILSLHLQPQQLRIGRMVARASDGDTPAIPEIAYVTNGSIVVERYQGRLPAGLAESLK